MRPLLCGFQSSSARTPARRSTTTTTKGIAMMRRASARAWRNACCAPRRKNRGYDDALSYYSSIRVVGKCVLPKAFVQGGKDAADAADAFEGQESIDVTREETDGETSVGQTGAVTSVQPGGLLVLEGLRSRACNLGRCCAFPVCKRKRFCWLTESRNRSRC